MDSLKKHINNFRRKLTRNLTKNIGGQDVFISETDKKHIRRVLIIRPNHRLGNMLMVTPIVQEVSKQFPYAKISIFVKGNAAYPIFQEYNSVENIISLPKKAFKDFFKYLWVWYKLLFNSYDLTINVIPHSSSGKIATQCSRSAFKLYGSLEPTDTLQCPNFNQQACHIVYSFREYLRKSGIQPIETPIPTMDLKLNLEELQRGKELLDSITQNNKKTLAIFTYATGNKCFSRLFWNSFYDALCKEFHQYNIVEILPVENISQIDFRASTFYSKDLREIGAFIANCEVFIGADSGMMHLASASLAPTIGLFSITEIESFKPYGNGSQAVLITKNNYQECLELTKKILSERRFSQV